ncbi:MAG: alpha/beta hydrolase [Pseudomonadota bacterium]
MRRALNLVVILVLLAGCEPVDIVNALTSTKSIQSIETFAYGDKPRQQLDIYAPRVAKDAAPILLFIHGGGWDSGDKGDYKFLAEAFTSAGYHVVVPNYRLYPDVIYPEIVADAAQALAWTAAYFSGQSIIVMGHSAGAHSALMLGLETPFLGSHGIDRCNTIAGVIGLAGPYGAVPLTQHKHIKIFPERFMGRDAPLNNVSAKVPPILLATGLADETVYPKNSVELAAALEAAEAAVELITYPDLDHVDVVKLLSHFFVDDGPVKTDLLRFMATRDGISGPFC